MTDVPVEVIDKRTKRKLEKIMFAPRPMETTAGGKIAVSGDGRAADVRKANGEIRRVAMTEDGNLVFVERKRKRSR